MPLSFIILAVMVIAGATAAMTLRNLIHCALALALTFLGLAGLFLDLQAQFAGFAQILIYVGAVSIVIVFAILLTRGGDPQEPPLSPRSVLGGGLVTVGVLAVLVGGMGGSHLLPRLTPAPAALTEPTVAQIGQTMMLQAVAPLLAMGVLLTAALVGALLLAMKEKPEKREPADSTR
ncbi:NADH-quinone oxidoreductase subunit J [Fontisphaera persica]|uniref:NADH-quinone oxidoreductase subunit J family protein n=1 Tax=Fontisphaera persica TaxID=2974023 RepID=UPI0024BF6584|nr:NADH-quinone oxidoreductase subunit J [Fontisphaera persica]WCJ59300.1 NADH-quinone oxidoreductase subunit J [Fontisphaera persica]